MRIPRKFFVTSGKGESDITVHAGSYHLALKEAGIEMCNIIHYSSILPGIAEEIGRPELVHGAVLEAIAATAYAEKGVTATAGIIYGWLYNKETGERFGGLVCEYNGHKTEKEAKIQLKASLYEIYCNGFSDKYNLKDEQFIIESFVPEKEHGTALVAICFIDYIVPGEFDA